MVTLWTENPIGVLPPSQRPSFASSIMLSVIRSVKVSRSNSATTANTYSIQWLWFYHPASKKHPNAILRKWVNLYRFALLANLWKVKILVIIISDLGIILSGHLWSIVHKLKTSFAIFNLCPTWVQVILKNPSVLLVPDLGTSEIPDTAPLAKLARSYLVQSLHKVKNDSYQN